MIFFNFELYFSVCQPNPCYPGVSCTAQAWHFRCGPCPPGTWGNGISCFKSNMADSTTKIEQLPSLTATVFATSSRTTAITSPVLTTTTPRAITARTTASTTETASTAETAPTSETASTTADHITTGVTATLSLPSTPASSPALSTPAPEVNSSIFILASSSERSAALKAESTRELCSSSPCYVNVTCTSVNGSSYTCGPCPPGYQVLPLLKLGKTCADFRQSSPIATWTHLFYHILYSLNRGIGRDVSKNYWQPSLVILTLYVIWPVQGDGEKCTRDYCQPSPCYLEVSCTSTNTGR